MDNKKYAAKDGYIIREIAGECLAVPINSDGGAHIVILNHVSRFIWEQLSVEKSFDELIDIIISEYQISAEQAGEDLKDFLNELENANLLK